MGKTQYGFREGRTELRLWCHNPGLSPFSPLSAPYFPCAAYFSTLKKEAAGSSKIYVGKSQMDIEIKEIRVLI